jgi:signal transduction histidine kinase
VDATPAESILADRKIAYCLTDRALTVTQVGGYAPIFPVPQAIVGSPLLDMVPELNGSERALADLLAGKLLRFELPRVNHCGDASAAPHLTMVDVPHRDARGQITGLIHLVQDMTGFAETEQRLIEQEGALRLLQAELQQRTLELTAAQAELQSLSQMKSTFISTAAHELRSPLTALTGYLELLQDNDTSNLTDVQREYLSIIEGSTQRLVLIISDLLDVTRIESGRIGLVLRPTDLAMLIETTAAEHASEYSEKGLQVTLNLPTGLPPALCDVTRAGQILNHLLSNATKFTPYGGSIAIGLGRATEDGYLLLTVTDSGIGVPRAEHDKVFERFYRASNVAYIGAAGAGLGLHIARSLIELHGGCIWLESDVDQGATFYVTFPIADTPSESEEDSIDRQAE